MMPITPDMVYFLTYDPAFENDTPMLTVSHLSDNEMRIVKIIQGEKANTLFAELTQK